MCINPSMYGAYIYSDGFVRRTAVRGATGMSISRSWELEYSTQGRAHPACAFRTFRSRFMLCYINLIKRTFCFYTVLSYIIAKLYYSTHMIWYEMIFFYFVWYNMRIYYVMWCYVIFCCITSYYTAFYYPIIYDIILCLQKLSWAK